MKSKQLKKAMIVVVVVMVVNALSYGTIIPLLYPYAKRFGLSASGLSVLFASFSLAQFLATPIIGRLSDKYGRKPMLILSLLGTAVSLALFASAKSISMLFVARILDGITGGNISVAQAMLSDLTPAEGRAKAFGMLGAVFGVGFVVGPAMGGILSVYGLTVPFWFASGLALVGTVVGMFLLEETNHHREVESGFALIDMAAFKKALRSEAVGKLMLLSFLVMCAGNAMIVGFQSFSVDVLALGPTEIGMLFSSYGVVSIIVQGFGIKWLLSKFESKRDLINRLLLASALIIMIVGLVENFWWFFVGMIFYAFSSSPIPALVVSMISANTRAEDQGGILGLNQSLTSLTQIIGPLLAGAVLFVDVRLPFVMAGAFLLTALVRNQRVGLRKKFNL